jgi:hypothetical protein
VAPPPPDGSRGCVATIRRLMQGVGHTVPCGTSRQALCDTLVLLRYRSLFSYIGLSRGKVPHFLSGSAPARNSQPENSAAAAEISRKS